MNSMIKNIGVAVCGVAVLWGVWVWGFCRFYVKPDQMAVITSKHGKELPPGQILADKNQKGIQKVVLGEGRHFLNPILYDHDIRPMIKIRPGQVGIVTSKVGEDLPEGEFIADPGQKGIWRGALSPGKYRLNPHGYQVDIVDAINIPIGYAGVVTSLSGHAAADYNFAKIGEKGILKDILQPGLYYVNPKEYKVDVLEIGLNQVSILGESGGEVITKGQMATQNAAMQELQDKVIAEQTRKRMDYLTQSGQSFFKSSAVSPSASANEKQRLDQEQVGFGYLQGDRMATMGLSEFVEFPSRDGFQIRLDMTFEFELLPSNIASILSRYGDLPAVVDKVIMPQITSISRNKGSEYRAKDFIMGEGREKFQKDLTSALADILAKKSIIVHNALIRHVEVPMQILDPIQQASIAIEQDLTNKEKQNTAKKLAELNTELSLIDQSQVQVAEETKKIVAEIHADQQKQTAEIKAEALRRVSAIEKDTAAIRADIVRTLGQAKAHAITLVEGEKANGLRLKSIAFDDPVAYSQWEFANGLKDEINIHILHTGPGTLWTDLEKAGVTSLGGGALLRGQQRN